MTAETEMLISLAGAAFALLVILAGLYAVLKPYFDARLNNAQIDRLMTLLDIDDMVKERMSLFAPRIRNETRIRFTRNRATAIFDTERYSVWHQ